MQKLRSYILFYEHNIPASDFITNQGELITKKDFCNGVSLLQKKGRGGSFEYMSSIEHLNNRWRAKAYTYVIDELYRELTRYPRRATEIIEKAKVLYRENDIIDSPFEEIDSRPPELDDLHNIIKNFRPPLITEDATAPRLHTDAGAAILWTVLASIAAFAHSYGKRYFHSTDRKVNLLMQEEKRLFETNSRSDVQIHPSLKWLTSMANEIDIIRALLDSSKFSFVGARLLFSPDGVLRGKKGIIDALRSYVGSKGSQELIKTSQFRNVSRVLTRSKNSKSWNTDTRSRSKRLGGGALVIDKDIEAIRTFLSSPSQDCVQLNDHDLISFMMVTSSYSMPLKLLLGKANEIVTQKYLCEYCKSRLHLLQQSPFLKLVTIMFLSGVRILSVTAFAVSQITVLMTSIVTMVFYIYNLVQIKVVKSSFTNVMEYQQHEKDFLNQLSKTNFNVTLNTMHSFLSRKSTEWKIPNPFAAHGYHIRLPNPKQIFNLLTKNAKSVEPSEDLDINVPITALLDPKTENLKGNQFGFLSHVIFEIKKEPPKALRPIISVVANDVIAQIYLEIVNYFYLLTSLFIITLMSKNMLSVIRGINEKSELDFDVVLINERKQALNLSRISNASIREYLQGLTLEPTPFTQTVIDLLRIDPAIPAVCLFHVNGRRRTLTHKEEVDVRSVMQAFMLYYRDGILQLPDSLFKGSSLRKI